MTVLLSVRRVLTGWGGVVARLVVGGVWVVAGWLKLGDPTESVRAVRAYDLLPEGLVPVVGHALPVLEVVIGLCLVLGAFVRASAVVSVVLLVAFVIGISAAWARGMSIECGCFGGGGGARKGASDSYPWEIARDVGLLALSLLLVWRPRTSYAVDSVLLHEVPENTPVPAPSGAGRRAERTRASAHAAAIRREAEATAQRRRNRVVLGVGLVVLALVVAIGASVQDTRDSTGVVATAPAGVVDGAVAVGETSSPKVVVDVYEDFQCPFCQEFEQASGATVERLSGQGVEFRYHLMAFLDRASTTNYSSRAMNAFAVVLDTSGAEVAKRFHDDLYREQPAEGSAGLSDDRLVALAVDAGAQRSEVEGPIREGDFAPWVTNATDAASRAGVTSTPTVRVDGKDVSGQDAAGIAAAMEKAVQEALA